MSSTLPETERRGGFGLVLWVLWLTYGSFYFCRTNIAAAVPGIEAELGIAKSDIGVILGSLKLAYGIGQFVNGQLAERAPPRVLLAIGMLCSAGLNVLFGFGTGFYFLLFVWACNGYVQALGWTPTMRVAANWFSFSARGRAIGIIGTGYQLTAALTYVISGSAASWFGWRGALWAPAALLVLSAVHMLVFLREAPSESDGNRVAARPAAANSVLRNVAITLGNPRLWLVAIGLGLLNASRYGFLDWGLAHVKEVQETGVGKAAFKYAILPLGGVVGAFTSGWATDRWFGGRRAPAICVLGASLGVMTLVYDAAVQTGVAPTVASLAAVGFCIYGAQVLLVGTAPVDLARHGTAAAAVGFVNAMGYFGAFLGDVVTGRLVDEHGWRVGVWFWAGCAFASAAIVAVLWRASGSEEERT